ncbi:MAG: 30S ribosomal protein S8e [Candidatus Aenigmarchaeota archaeon]|nr:30S ribosomal protein S8e [Candidatus Aenigmarchaeota archaeon]
MAIVQIRSKRKPTGGLLNRLRKRKKRDFGSDFIPIKIGKKRSKKIRAYGGNYKQRLMEIDVANINGKKVKILSVKENPANPNFVRMNIITKGAIIETEIGLAKVTSRPGQHGTVNAKLIK